MKNSLWISFLLALLVSGCSQEDMFRNQPSVPEGRVFTTSFEGSESRTYLDGKLSYWTEDDCISLFDGNTQNLQYKFDGKTGDNSGTFSIVGKPSDTGNLLTANYAIYPYDKEMKISTEGVITATLPAKQSYVPNSYGLGANTMVAVTQAIDDTFLTFKNVGGYIKLQLYGNNVTVKSITLKGNNNEKIAGKAAITPIYDQDPTIDMTDDATGSITLDCGKGIKLGSTAETATAFWMVLPPTIFEKGITVTVYDVTGKMFIQTTAKKLEIKRNMVKPMAAVEAKPDVPYLTFVAGSSQKLTMSKAVENLEYSVGGGTWSELGTNTVEFGGELGILRLRGSNLNGTAESSTNYSDIDFKNDDVCVACYGDIRTLLDYKSYTTVDTQNARFSSLFSGCAQLTSAPKLPATTLADWCYSGMFYQCWRLTEAPELPATTLARSCYETMFSSCSGLIKAPELPATTLADYCYQSMFGGCTSLKEAPALPATTLTDGCYRNMFYECESLISAPDLPATTLARGCYSNMFDRCYDLVHVPALLPATTLTEECYSNMFLDCTSLTTAPKLPALTMANKCYHEMFNGCSSLVKAPELPATMLAWQCYTSMFSMCHSLTEAPELPATTLASTCYRGMFSYCESLTKAPDLPATILDYACYAHMFDNCTSLTTAPALPATVLESLCYSGMFQDCTSLTTAPILHAAVLKEKCYANMFQSCKLLDSVIMLATDISASYCLDKWLSGVSSTGTVYKSKEMESLKGIPSGWTVMDYNF